MGKTGAKIPVYGGEATSTCEFGQGRMQALQNSLKDKPPARWQMPIAKPPSFGDVALSDRGGAHDKDMRNKDTRTDEGKTLDPLDDVIPQQGMELECFGQAG